MFDLDPLQARSGGVAEVVPLLVDAETFSHVSSVTKEWVQLYVIHTEKRRAIDAESKPLFKPRRTELAPVSWEERHRDQRLLYEAVTEYVREGYN